MYLEEIKVRKEKITSETNRSGPRDCGIFWCSPRNCVHPMTQTPRTFIKEASNP